MRISLRNGDGQEVDFRTAEDSHAAVYDAMMLLSKRDKLTAGDILIVDDDGPQQQPGGLQTVGVGQLQSLASRLEQRAKVVGASQPLSADDLRLAARLCRHIVRVGWAKASIEIV